MVANACLKALVPTLYFSACTLFFIRFQCFFILFEIVKVNVLGGNRQVIQRFLHGIK